MSESKLHPAFDLPQERLSPQQMESITQRLDRLGRERKHAQEVLANIDHALNGLSDEHIHLKEQLEHGLRAGSLAAAEIQDVLDTLKNVDKNFREVRSERIKMVQVLESIVEEIEALAISGAFKMTTRVGEA